MRLAVDRYLADVRRTIVEHLAEGAADERDRLDAQAMLAELGNAKVAGSGP